MKEDTISRSKGMHQNLQLILAHEFIETLQIRLDIHRTTLNKYKLKRGTRASGSLGSPKVAFHVIIIRKGQGI